MKVVKPSFEIICQTPDIMKLIERAGRTCYKSEDKMCEGSDEILVKKLRDLKHFSTYEHGVITVKFVTDRGVTHELVRHRIAAFSQESTRYCNYSKDKYGNEITVIDPFFFDPNEPRQMVSIPSKLAYDLVSGAGTPASVPTGLTWHENVFMNSFDVWFVAGLWSEWAYNTLTQQFKRSAQEARSVLPNSLKTEIMVTANIREWIHILNMRTNRDAHPQIREIMVPLGHKLAKKYPIIFGEFADIHHPSPATETGE